jgi:hypothetical protein
MCMTLNAFYNRLCYTLDCPPRVNPMRWAAMVKWNKNRCNEGLTPAAYLSMMWEAREISYANYMGEDA